MRVVAPPSSASNLAQTARTADGGARQTGRVSERALPDLDDYAARVLDVVDRVPPGQVVTYGDVAEYLGAGGPRQVGAVMSRHGGAVSWWRVLRADGTPAPGLERAAFARYREEGTPLRPSGTRVDMVRARWPGDGG